MPSAAPRRVFNLDFQMGRWNPLTYISSFSDKNSLNILSFLIGAGVRLVGPAVIINGKLARTGMSASDVVEDAETKS